MLAITIILSVLLILALIRIGVIIEYNDAQLDIRLKIAFLRLRIDHKDGYNSRTGNFLRKRIPGSISPGNAHNFMNMLSIIKDLLKRLKRRLLVKKLLIYYTFADEDPAATALQFGAANALYGVIMPILDRHLRIKHRNIRTSVDFESNKNSIYLFVNLSIAVWETIYVLAAILPLFRAMGEVNAPAIITTETNSKEF